MGMMLHSCIWVNFVKVLNSFSFSTRVVLSLLGLAVGISFSWGLSPMPLIQVHARLKCFSEETPGSILMKLIAFEREKAICDCWKLNFDLGLDLTCKNCRKLITFQPHTSVESCNRPRVLVSM